MLDIRMEPTLPSLERRNKAPGALGMQRFIQHTNQHSSHRLRRRVGDDLARQLVQLLLSVDVLTEKLWCPQNRCTRFAQRLKTKE